VVAGALAEPGREGRAISIVFGGVAISTVVGVPLGTLVGQTLGWHATFAGIVILGGGALALAMTFVPRVQAGSSGRLGDEARSIVTFPVVATLGVGFLIIGGQFTALTFLAAFLDRVTGISGGAISGVLLAFGIATAAGAFASGHAADRSAAGMLIAANAGIATGALVGGAVVAELGVRQVALAGALILLVSLPATAAASALGAEPTTRAPAPVEDAVA
jgi:DHA1 family inner membrane transport protein